MKYIINEDELVKQFEDMKLAGYLIGDHRLFAKDFLKDKKPVELISSGKITMPYDDILMYPDIKPDDLAKYIGSEVNFYIEEEL